MRPDDTKARKMLEEYGKQVPDFPDIAYGDHERNKLDLYLAKSDTPTPVVIHIHGGGFRGGNKSGARASIIALCRQSGISVVPINYRLTKHATYPAQMHDAARAVQFLRHNAKRWNLDPKRFAATGGSAGGGISLWLACHDDLADPDSDDPVARQSTRLTCAAVINTQSTYDPREMDKLLGPTQDGTPRMLSLYGLNPEEADTPEAHKMYVDASAAPHVSADDPPVFMMYSHPNTPITSETTRSQKIHHPVFGDYLKSKMDPLGIECIVRYGTDYPGDNKDEKIINADPDIVRFFRRQFKIDQ